jgi:AraC family transcriptional regulator of arabinose operon
MDDSTESNNTLTEGFLGQRMVIVSPLQRKKLLRNQFSKLLYVNAAGYYPVASAHQRKRNTGSEEYIIIYCIAGEGWIDIEDKHYQLAANGFKIIPKNIPHQYGSSAERPWSIYWLHFNGDHAETLYKRYLNTTSADGGYISFDEQRIVLFNDIIDMMEIGFDDLQLELIYIRALRLISSYIYQEPRRTADNADIVKTSINYMREHINQNLQIKDLAANANYSVSRYSEVFRQATGYAPMQYFTQLRIHHACQHLCFSSLNIKQVCGKLGFTDPFYFSKLFKQHTGRSPNQYRKLHHKP